MSFQLGCIEVIATDQVRVAIGPPDLEPDDLPGKRINSAMQSEPELVFPLVMLVNTPHVPNACAPKSGPFYNSLASSLHKVPFIQMEVCFEHFSVERFTILPILPSVHLPRNRETIVMKEYRYTFSRTCHWKILVYLCHRCNDVDLAGVFLKARVAVVFV